jgi:hypothetical protein
MAIVKSDLADEGSKIITKPDVTLISVKPTGDETVQ